MFQAVESLKVSINHSDQNKGLMSTITNISNSCNLQNKNININIALRIKFQMFVTV